MESICSSLILNTERSTSVSNGLNGLRFLVEDPLLGVLVGNMSLNGDAASTNNVHGSAHWESRDNVEWSIDIESEVTVEALSTLTLDGVQVNNVPFLVAAVVSVPGDNVLTFLVLATPDIESLIVLDIHELFSLVSEELEPSGVGVSNLHVG